MTMRDTAIDKSLLATAEYRCNMFPNAGFFPSRFLNALENKSRY